MDPEAGGEPPTNTPALFKPDSAVNQRPRIWIKKTGLRRYGDQKVKKESLCTREAQTCKQKLISPDAGPRYNENNVFQRTQRGPPCQSIVFASGQKCLFVEIDMERLLQKGRMKRRKKEKKNFSSATLSDLQQSKRAHLIAPNVSSVYAALLVPR
ncbi:hypothetical protein F2P81_002361 [Scophthalmus maximus]|uniref:Uncharacterized protein n=1 Tax=Scophthalmus maximus TaxID=52904 RepID=A0A6A4TUZ6_SCOMX|nr:hypothetical protein F2P81_002361 [Scophthalmus maximus]